MEFLHQPAAVLADVLADHLFLIVFLGFLVEGAGIPFPSRLMLIVAATFAGNPRELVLLGAACAGGALIGDHVPYAGGMLAGPRILGLYCRLTLGSAECVERTVHYFRRFGAAAILLSRFSASIRIFASALSGCGHIAYRRFLAYNVVGTLIYATLWIAVGHLLGDRAGELLRRYAAAKYLVLLGPLALAALLGYRLWRRSRYGPARAGTLAVEAKCLRNGAASDSNESPPARRAS